MAGETIESMDRVKATIEKDIQFWDSYGDIIHTFMTMLVKCLVCTTNKGECDLEMCCSECKDFTKRHMEKRNSQQ